MLLATVAAAEQLAQEGRARGRRLHCTYFMQCDVSPRPCGYRRRMWPIARSVALLWRVSIEYINTAVDVYVVLAQYVLLYRSAAGTPNI